MYGQEPASYLTDNYKFEGEYFFAQYLNFQVFRHRKKEQFAVLMDILGEKLGLSGDSLISVVNLDVTVALYQTVQNKKIKFQLDMCYEVTK